MVKMKKKKVHPKSRTDAFKAAEPAELVEAPHSYIIHRGLACPYITDLTMDFRRIMEPFTAMNLRERKKNRIKDFVSMSGFFHVSHMGIFNKAATQLSFKIARMPRGPTLTFKVHQFTLARDVLSSHKKQYVDSEMFKHSPLVVLNNFVEGRHMKLMASTFQNMFPAINLAQVNIATIRRCLLFSYNSVANVIDVRHYAIQVVPVGLSRGVKKLVMGKIPNLTNLEDISDFIMNDGGVSESEAEEDENSQVVLPQTIKRKGNLEDNKSAIKLHELGPRLTLQLMKIEEGLMTGEVLYHDHIMKTEEEKEELRKQIEKKKKLKEQRKRVQAENRAKKLKEAEAKNRKTGNKDTTEDAVDDEPDDDAQYFKEEVGEEPDKDLFKNSTDTGRVKLRSAMKRNKKFKQTIDAKQSKKSVGMKKVSKKSKRIKK